MNENSGEKKASLPSQENIRHSIKNDGLKYVLQNCLDGLNASVDFYTKLLPGSVAKGFVNLLGCDLLSYTVGKIKKFREGEMKYKGEKISFTQSELISATESERDIAQVLKDLNCMIAVSIRALHPKLLPDGVNIESFVADLTLDYCERIREFFNYTDQLDLKTIDQLIQVASPEIINESITLNVEKQEEIKEQNKEQMSEIEKIEISNSAQPSRRSSGRLFTFWREDSPTALSSLPINSCGLEQIVPEYVTMLANTVHLAIKFLPKNAQAAFVNILALDFCSYVNMKAQNMKEGKIIFETTSEEKTPLEIFDLLNVSEFSDDLDSAKESFTRTASDGVRMVVKLLGRNVDVEASLSRLNLEYRERINKCLRNLLASPERFPLLKDFDKESSLGAARKMGNRG